MNADERRWSAAVLALAVTLVTGRALAGAEDEVKATFERFVAAQNAHDALSVRELLLDSPTFLWVTRGTPVWGREEAFARFEVLHMGTWKLSPEMTKLKVILLSDTSAQLFVPITFNVAPPGEPAPDTPVLMNQTLVKTAGGWRIASILGIPLPAPAPGKATGTADERR